MCKYPLVVLSTYLLMDPWAASITLAIIHNIAMNIGVLVFFELVFWVTLDIFSEVRALGQKEDPFLMHPEVAEVRHGDHGFKEEKNRGVGNQLCPVWPNH